MKFSVQNMQCFFYISITVLPWMRIAFCNLLKTLDIGEQISIVQQNLITRNSKKYENAFETFFRIRQGVTGASLNFLTQKFVIFFLQVYILCVPSSRTTQVAVFQLCKFTSSLLGKLCYKYHPKNFPELNALNIFSVKVKDRGLPDSQREINLVIFFLNYILIHLNIFPYSVLKIQYRVSKNVSIRYNINDCVHNRY